MCDEIKAGTHIHTINANEPVEFQPICSIRNEKWREKKYSSTFHEALMRVGWGFAVCRVWVVGRRCE